MISLGPAKAALANLRPPSVDAAFMKTAVDLAQSGNMFQNPMGGSLDKISGLGLDKMGSSLAKIPGCADLAAKCAKVANTSAEVQGVSSQMFTSVLPTTKALPPSLMSLNPSLTDADKAKLADFTVPSITDVISTAQAEQADNEAMGTSGDNPCLPVQKSMEGAMKTAGALSSGVDDALSKFGIGDKLKDIQAAADKLANAVGDELQAAQSALNSLVSSVSSDLNKGLDAISGLVEDAGKSLVDSIKTVRDSAEKSMQLATAGMAKDLIKNNPCMKDVMSPGSGGGAPGSIGVYEYTTKFRFRNVKYPTELKDPDNGLYAGLLANSNNLKYNTVLSSLGHETWDCSCVVISSDNEKTIVECKITYTVDIDKAIKNYVTFFDKEIKDPATGAVIRVEKETIDNISFIKFFEDGDLIGKVTPQITIQDAKTAPKMGTSTLNFAQNFLVLDGDILWSGGKKPSLMSPEMQQISQPASEPMPDLPVTTAPPIFQTEEQVKEEEVKEAKEMKPPEIKAEPTKVVVPETPPAPDPQPKYQKSVEMGTELTPKSAKWKDVHSVTTSADKIVGSLMVMLNFNPDAPPTITYKYQIDSWQIDEVIAQIMSKARTKIGGDLHYDNIKVTFWRKDGTEFGHGYFSFHMSYYSQTQQMGIQTGYAAGDSESYDFKWDYTVFKDDK
jgi:hypothetical protein